MTCLSEAQLQSFCDGALAAGEMNAAATHINACDACSAHARAVEEELSLISLALAVDAEPTVPTERLRAGLAAQIAREKYQRQESAFSLNLQTFASTQRLRRALTSLFAPNYRHTAVAACSAIVVALLTGAWLMISRSSQATSDSARAVSPVAYNPIAPVAIRDGLPPEPVIDNSKAIVAPIIKTNYVRPVTTATTDSPRVKLLPGEKSYLKAIIALKATIEAQKPVIQPDVRLEYERNLEIVNQAIAASRMAAQRDPRDTDANYQLLSAYQSKVELLSAVAGQTQTSYGYR